MFCPKKKQYGSATITSPYCLDKEWIDLQLLREIVWL